MNRLRQALGALVERIDTAAPIVPAHVMRDGIDRIQGFAAEHSLDVRPHVKTHKCVEIGRRQVKAETNGITVGNVGEAEVFAEAGFDGIFIAHPIRPAGNDKGRGSGAWSRRPVCGSASTTSRPSAPSPMQRGATPGG
ncbi:hypothetical protein ABZT06_02980 [Streptomyces sp. NPDC005483]|uniref:hypothetical protein n=1 Tax=Streptomyces sp. NPDC005483 TaxID=3154882 RepID=UPI0033BBCF17